MEQIRRALFPLIKTEWQRVKRHLTGTMSFFFLHDYQTGAGQHWKVSSLVVPIIINLFL